MSVLSSKVVLLRGYSANPWDLRPWSELPKSFEPTCVVTKSNLFNLGELPIQSLKLSCTRDFFPRGRLGDVAAYAAGERYFGLKSVLAGAQIVHGAELGSWFTAQAARLKRDLSFKLVVTVWETIPFLDTYRSHRPTRKYRREVLAATDLFLPTTERARRALLLEGVSSERIQVCPPGIDRTHFVTSQKGSDKKREKLILSPGRLVWEKGHQDVIRAFAALVQGVVPVAGGALEGARLLIVGSGSEQRKLERYADELGVGDKVEVGRSVAYSQMPSLYSQATCMVLASLPLPTWEEQFGMVLAEGMATGLPILAARSGAIPEVLAGRGRLFDPGDWIGLAALLADTLNSFENGELPSYDDDRLELLSTTAAAERIADLYQRLLSL